MIINITQENPLRFRIHYEYKINNTVITQSYENLSKHRVREVVDLVTEQFLNSTKDAEQHYVTHGNAD